VIQKKRKKKKKNKNVFTEIKFKISMIIYYLKENNLKTKL
jgi:hypothetical protein